MKLKQLSALVLAASAFTATSAMAWESADGQFNTSASVALSSDYMWRGASQTDSEPAISGSLDVGHASGIYAGVWASNVNYDIGMDAAHIELNYYAGYASEIGDTGISYDVGALRYAFPGTDGANWNEAYLGLGYSHFSLKVSHSGDALATSESGTHYLLGFDYDLPMDIGFHANYAFYDLDDDINDDTLQDYNLGVTKNLVGFDFDLTYFKTLSDAEDFVGDNNLTDSRFVFTISKSL
jgi:uncharacterized protein (TIGR02001 family)